MKFGAAVIDTNVVVAGLLTARADSPPARILDGMRLGAFPFLLSTELLAEYREVLLRPGIRKLHGLAEGEIDELLIAIAANAIMREPEARMRAPHPKDDHVWSLVDSGPNCVLVTGDLALFRKPPSRSMILRPRAFIDSLAAY